MTIALWVRLIAVIAFAIFVGVQDMWLLVGVSILVIGLTIWQLVAAYRHHP
ncbi:hypothetical protein [Corynebacterium guangdongense]|uniref:Secreted protein n=1 Tax=Corynebacterium guangdongense TaxID=1783348 RepID=A0ABU1ZWT1_9CORY|nr:hypothetical protein [Corynebacterium guangdongense]MDR7329320.1 hypothetical protein [Corynebacterium guangdongense]WJZ17886.1 hypothetical protein CGUA_06580 [Corynebacterium guangdongense]